MMADFDLFWMQALKIMDEVGDELNIKYSRLPLKERTSPDHAKDD